MCKLFSVVDIVTWYDTLIKLAIIWKIILCNNSEIMKTSISTKKVLDVFSYKIWCLDLKMYRVFILFSDDKESFHMGLIFRSRVAIVIYIYMHNFSFYWIIWFAWFAKASFVWEFFKFCFIVVPLFSCCELHGSKYMLRDSFHGWLTYWSWSSIQILWLYCIR